MVEYPHGQVRAVTHYGVTAADIETDHRRDPGGARRDESAVGRRHDRLTRPRPPGHRRQPRRRAASRGAPEDPRP